MQQYFHQNLEIPDWPLQKINVQLLEVGTLSQIKLNAIWVMCLGPEGQVGKVKTYVANIAINFGDMICYNDGKHRLTFLQSQKQPIK